MQHPPFHSVLIIENDPESHELLHSLLSQTFEDVVAVHDGTEGLKAYRLYHPDVVIVGADIAAISAAELIRTMRRIDPECFIALLSIREDRRMLMEAVSLKLDSYILKPLTSAKLAELVNEIASYRQRLTHHYLPIHAEAYYDSKAKIVRCGGQRIFLTHSEITLLELFLYYRGETLLYDTIEYALYGSEEKSRNGVKILISNLRKKIPGISIRSIPKVGYLWDPDPLEQRRFREIPQTV